MLSGNGKELKWGCRGLRLFNVSFLPFGALLVLNARSATRPQRQQIKAKWQTSSMREDLNKAPSDSSRVIPLWKAAGISAATGIISYAIQDQMLR